MLSVDTLKFIGKNIYRTIQFQANITEHGQNTDFLHAFTHLVLKEKAKPDFSQRTNIPQEKFLR